MPYFIGSLYTWVVFMVLPMEDVLRSIIFQEYCSKTASKRAFSSPQHPISSSIKTKKYHYSGFYMQP
ncbi:MAG: hypothetical protein WCP52_08165 [Bacteroidota bacterium]